MNYTLVGSIFFCLWIHGFMQAGEQEHKNSHYGYASLDSSFGLTLPSDIQQELARLDEQHERDIRCTKRRICAGRCGLLVVSASAYVAFWEFGVMPLISYIRKNGCGNN